jgi:hypothetical protein
MAHVRGFEPMFGRIRTTRARRSMLVLALAGSAGAHAALAPSHAGGAPLVGLLFAASALALAVLAVLADRSERPTVLVGSALVLGALLALYVASRLVVVWPLEHAEPVDAIGVITKLFETAGLVLALGLLQAARGSDETLPALQEGVTA